MIDETKFDKLEKEELENVSGGCGDDGGKEPVGDGPEYDVINLECSSCGRSYRWEHSPIPTPENCPNCDVCGAEMHVKSYGNWV